jgi:cobalt-zinc-cadmium efflux system protein
MKTQRNILIAFLLNLGFSIFELIGGIFTHSVAIISDALHDFGDAISIGASWFLERKSQRKPDAAYTYGYGRFSVLGAAITNLILLVGSLVVIVNAIERIINPVEINSNGMILMAVLGAAMNLAAAWFTHGGESLNEKAVNLHMLEDVLGWVVVLVGAIAIRFTNFTLIDPIMSIGVAVFILIHAVQGMGEVLNVFMEKTPDGIDPRKLEKRLLRVDHVKGVHHLHVWSLDGYNHYATLHVVADDCDTAVLKNAIRKELEHHGVTHVTMELEKEGEACPEMHCNPRKPHAGCGHHHHHHGHSHGHKHHDHEDCCGHDHGHKHHNHEGCCGHHDQHDHHHDHSCGCGHEHHDHAHHDHKHHDHEGCCGHHEHKEHKH